MGFMAGFGPAFNRSMELRREAENNKKDDLFKMRFAETLDQKEKFEAREREVAKNTKLAKALLQSTGTNPSALPTVFNWIDSGMSPEAIQKNLMTGKITVNEKSPVDQQMQSSGMAPPAAQDAPAASTPEPRNTGLLHTDPKNPATKFKLPGMFNRTERINRDVDQRLTEATGMSPEQIAGMKPNYDPMDESGVQFTPAAPEEQPDPISTVKESAVSLAKATQAYNTDPSEVNKKALETAQLRDNALKGAVAWENAQEQGNFSNTVVSIDPKTKIGTVQLATQTPDGYVDMNGQPVPNARPLSELEQKELFNLGTGQTEIPKYIEAVADVGSLTRNFKLADDIVQSDPRVLSSLVSGGAKLAQRASTELEAIQQTLDADGNFTDGTKKAVDENVQMYQEMLGKDVTNLALKTKLFDALQVQMAYSLARLEGQTGTGSSNKDIDRFMSMLDSSGDPDTFRQTMANQIVGRISELEQQGQLINEWNGKAKAFAGATGWMPGAGVVPADVRTELGNSKDPLVRGGLETLLKYSNRGPIEGTGKAAVNSNPNAVKVKQKHLERLKANPTDEEKAMFDEAYGQPGLADRILNGEQ